MKSLLRQSLTLLKSKRIPQPHRSLQILHKQCFFNSDSPQLTSYKLKKFKHLIKLRSFNYPVQYLCQFWPFRSLQLKLRRPVLVPRFQTQYMIDVLHWAIKQKYGQNYIKGLNFVEYGCGSGALGLSLVKQFGMTGTMIDINKQCIDLTLKNMKLNKITQQSIKLIHSDMQNHLNLLKHHDIIISNPPYLSESHYKFRLLPQIKKYQSKQALVAQQNGMKYVHMLCKQWRDKREKPGIIIVEFDGRGFKANTEYSWMEKFVVNDQYGKRRFILMTK